MVAFSFAILTWQNVEQALYNIFWILMNKAQPYALSAAFHAVISLNTRIQMTDDVAKVLLAKDHPDVHTGWKALSKKLKNLSQLRNEMAHYTMGNGNLKPQPLDFLADQTKTLELSDLYLRRESFIALHGELLQFAGEIVRALKP